jgi:hypothetical protein
MMVLQSRSTFTVDYSSIEFKRWVLRQFDCVYCWFLGCDVSMEEKDKSTLLNSLKNTFNVFNIENSKGTNSIELEWDLVFSYFRKYAQNIVDPNAYNGMMMMMYHNVAQILGDKNNNMTGFKSYLGLDSSVEIFR